MYSIHLLALARVLNVVESASHIPPCVPVLGSRFQICTPQCTECFLYFGSVIIVDNRFRIQAARGDTHTIRNSASLSTKYFQNFFTSRNFLYSKRESGRNFFCHVRQVIDFLARKAKQSTESLMESLMESCHAIYSPFRKNNRKQSPLVSCWSQRLSCDRSRCCLSNRNHPVHKRQEKNATY